MPFSCALLGGFAIGARFRCYDDIAQNAKCQRVLVLDLCLVVIAYISLSVFEITVNVLLRLIYATTAC